MNRLTESLMQCWTCPIFDRLFQIISETAAAAYQRLTIISAIILVILLGFFIINAVWQNIKKGGEDPFFQKSLRPVLIKSLIVLSLLSAGLMVPRLISTFAFEPVAEITYGFSENIVKTMNPNVNVAQYPNPINLSDNGFFTPDLRNTILKILETSVSNFQVYIQIGIDIMDKAFSIRSLLKPGSGILSNLIRHIIIFFVGLYLTYNFGKLFIKYSFCFRDIIVAMAMFAFFFPLSLIFFVFKYSNSAPGWMKVFGGDSAGQIKKLINAIVSVLATILTYTIIMLVIDGFLDTNAISDPQRSLFEFDLDNSGAMEITVVGAIVLVYVVNYIADEIPNVTQKIFSAFGVQQEDALSEEMGKNMWKLTTLATDNAKKLAKTIINPESAKAATPKGTTK